MKTNILISSILSSALLLVALPTVGADAAMTKQGMCDAIGAIQTKAIPEANKKDALKVAVAECMKGEDADVKTMHDNVSKLPK